MHDHDLDLIAEYASDLLVGGDASRAADLVRRCADCAQEFADHREIRQLLALAPPPALSEFERTRLRRSVLDSLAPPAATVPVWQRRFLAVVGTAAAMLVLVVGIGVLGDLGGDDSFTQAEGSDLTTTTIAADAFVPMAEDSAQDEAMGALADGDSERLTEESASGGGLPLLIDVGVVDDPAHLDAVLEELSALLLETTEPVPVEEALDFGASCAGTFEDEIPFEGEILGVVLATLNGVPTEIFLTGERTEPSVTMLVAPDCLTR